MHGHVRETLGDRRLAILEPLRDRRGQDSEEQPLRPLPFLVEFGERPFEGRERRVPFEQPAVGFGVDADPCDQFDLVGQLDE